MMPPMIDAGPVEEFVSGAMRIVQAEGRDLGVLRWGESWFALRNICPHLGAPVCTGPVQPYLGQDDTGGEDLVVDHDRPVITCPWHHWEFDLATGRSLIGADRLRVYPVEIVDGRVMVRTARARGDV